MSSRIPFKCHDREFELDSEFRHNGTQGVFNAVQTNRTKICLTDATLHIQQSLTFEWVDDKTETKCKIRCEHGTFAAGPTVTLGSNLADKDDSLKTEKERCLQAYETVAISIIQKYGCDPQSIVKYLRNASEDELRKAFGDAIAFAKETDGPHAPTAEGEAVEPQDKAFGLS